MKRISICIDDFGLHDGINTAALLLAQTRRITAISCLVGAESWRNGSNALLGLKPEDVDLGLHLDFTEFPLHRTLRHALPSLIISSYSGRLNRKLVRAEIEAQFAAFEKQLGRLPDFVDGHQHVHQLPIIRDELLSILHQLYPGRKPWLRSTRMAPSAHPPNRLRISQHLKPLIIAGLGSRDLAQMAAKNGYPQNRHLLGCYNFDGDVQHYRGLLSTWLQLAGDGDLLMSHASTKVNAADPLLTARLNEFSTLSSTEFPSMLQHAGITLAHLSHVLAEST